MHPHHQSRTTTAEEAAGVTRIQHTASTHTYTTPDHARFERGGDWHHSGDYTRFERGENWDPAGDYDDEGLPGRGRRHEPLLRARNGSARGTRWVTKGLLYPYRLPPVLRGWKHVFLKPEVKLNRAEVEFRRVFPGEKHQVNVAGVVGGAAGELQAAAGLDRGPAEGAGAEPGAHACA